jgi:hypothetical protein
MASLSQQPEQGGDSSPGAPSPRVAAWQAEYRGLPHTVMWCRGCRLYHLHGADAGGHRFSHCALPDSPYYESDYVLIDAGRAPAAILADLDRQSAGGRFIRRAAAGEGFAVNDRGDVVTVAPPLPGRARA